MNDKIHLEKLDQIYVPGGLGSSYHAEKCDPDSSRCIGRIESIQVVEGVEIADTQDYFIKCSDDLPATPTDFVEKEYANGISINNAAQTLAKEAASLVNQSGCSAFIIPRMLGKGHLFAEQYGIKKQPCLLYEYAGDPSKGRQGIDVDFRTTPPTGLSETGLPAFAKSFARAVQVLHNQGIVHTFIVPRNIIRKGWPQQQDKAPSLTGKFSLVGFGYARLLDAAGKSTQEKVAPEDDYFRAPECRQAQTHACFDYPADIYSIGAILYWLLLGPNRDHGMRVLKSPPTDAKRLKRDVAHYLHTSQKGLFDENENILKIIDTCLRYYPEERYSCVEELLEAIEIAKAEPTKNKRRQVSNSKSSASPNISILKQTQFVNQISQLKTTNEKKQDSAPSQLLYFEGLRRALAGDLYQSYHQIEHGHFEVYGHRDRIITSLCRLLGSAGNNDIYRTMTLPHYWTDDNLGRMGRFLTMNKHKARKGITIQRLFLVSQPFHCLPEEEQTVLEEQRDAAKGLDKFELRVLMVNKSKIADFEKEGSLVAYMQQGGKNEKNEKKKKEENYEKILCLNFFSTARETWTNGEISVRRTIKKVRFWNPALVNRRPQFKENREAFRDNWQKATTLGHFIDPKSSHSDKSPSVTLEDLLGVPSEDP